MWPFHTGIANQIRSLIIINIIKHTNSFPIFDFRPPIFHNSNPAGPLTNKLKYFLVCLDFAELSEFFGVSYCTAQSQFPCRIILRRVNLPAESYFAESISLQYHTTVSQSPCSIILR